MNKKRNYTHRGLSLTNTAIILTAIFLSGAILYNTYYKTNNTDKIEPIVFSQASPESQGISNQSMTELLDTVQGFVDHEEIVGAELLVIKNSQIILHEAVGWQNKETQTPMKTNTVFNIRSMSKPITGTVIQQLIDQGKITPDTKVSTIIPGFDNPQSRDITIQQLLTHTSGLPLSTMTTLDDYPSLQAIANATGTNGPQFTPGETFWYSDAGADVLGAIIEKVSGQTLDEYITENVLMTLGMNNTFYYYEAIDDPRVDRIADLYVGSIGAWNKYWSTGTPFYRYPLGSQGLYGTTIDYARFLSLWIDQGMVGETRYLSEEAMERVLTPVNLMCTLGSDMQYPDGFYELDAHYGQMAILFTDDTETPKVYGHSGSDGTYAWAWPEEDMIILYFTQSRGTSTGVKLEAKIDELLIHPELKEINREARIEYAEYLGTYIANFGPFINTEFNITIQNGALGLDIPNQIIYELYEKPDQIWGFKLREDVTLSFTYEGETVTALLLNQSGMVFELPKGIASQETQYPAEMEKYTGTYDTEDPEQTMQVVIHDGMLALVIPGQPFELDLYPPNVDGLWLLKVNPATGISFNEANDEVESLVFHFPDGSTITRNKLN